MFKTVFCALFFLCVSSSCSAEKNMASGNIFLDLDSNKKIGLSIEMAQGKIFIYRCVNGECKKITTPPSINKDFANGSTEVSLDDLDADGVSELLLSSTHKVNKCSSAFKANANGYTLEKITGLNGDICNYKKTSNYLVSSYRRDAKQIEDVYEAKSGKLSFLYSDECVGCPDEIRRVYANMDVELVAQNKDFLSRTSVYSTVISKKAYLYGDNKKLSPSKMYLIKSDVVRLLDLSSDNDSFWFLIEYKPASKKYAIKKWIDCMDLLYCGSPKSKN